MQTLGLLSTNPFHNTVLPTKGKTKNTYIRSNPLQKSFKPVFLWLFPHNDIRYQMYKHLEYQEFTCLRCWNSKTGPKHNPCDEPRSDDTSETSLFVVYPLVTIYNPYTVSTTSSGAVEAPTTWYGTIQSLPIQDHNHQLLPKAGTTIHTLRNSPVDQ